MEEKPPLFPKWSYWYWLLMIFAALQLLLYWWLTKTFS